MVHRGNGLILCNGEALEREKSEDFYLWYIKTRRRGGLDYAMAKPLREKNPRIFIYGKAK